MNIVLWIIQIILAGMFVLAGVIKTTQPKEKLATNMPWVNDYSLEMVRFVGISELLGGIGMLVPWLTGIAPVLTPIAASGLAVIMVLAAVYHFRKEEYKGVIFNAVLFLLAVVVAYFRF